MEDNSKFKTYMDNLTRIAHKEAVEAIMKECMVTRYTIYQWKGGTIRIRPYYKQGIEKALSVKIF